MVDIRNGLFVLRYRGPHHDAVDQITFLEFPIARVLTYVFHPQTQSKIIVGGDQPGARAAGQDAPSPPELGFE